jgi:hypothetical protein
MAYSTIADLLELAIQIEQASQQLYARLETKFPGQPEVAAFWRRYAAEELGHARWIENLRTKSAPELLTKKTDAEMLSTADRMLKFSAAHALKTVSNLEDAYQLATDLENSETNAIFEFLIANYGGDPNTITFLRTQLNLHINRLKNEMPAAYRSKSERQALAALAE